MKRVLLSFAVVTLGVSVLTAQVKKSTVEGITNLAQVETTVACTGSITPTSVAGIKRMGFAAIINLRQASEKGADLEAEAEAAKAAGIRFISLPFDGSKPDSTVADQFLKTIQEAGNQPAFIHCASGSRAATMWFLKRVLIDKWDNDEALDEATQLGMASPALKAFALRYIEAHK